MNFLLVVVLIILFINKIIILKKECKERNKRLWPIYFSSLFAEVVSLLEVYIVYTIYIGISFSDFISFCIICLICIIENFILLIVGIVYFIKQKKKIKNIKLKKYILLKVLFTFFIICSGMFLIIYMPKIFKTETEKYIENYVIKYMTTKYGDLNFKVINIAKDYSGGFFGVLEEQSGYYVKIKTNYIDEIIRVVIDGTTKETIEISYDSLIIDYHKLDDIVDIHEYLTDKKIEKLEAEYMKYFDIDIDLNCYYRVPDDYGHIPSIDELVELCSVDTSYINIKVNDYIDENNELDYFIRLAKYLLNYFVDEEEENIYYKFDNKNGFIKINNNIITIKIGYEEKIYSMEYIKSYMN